MAGFNLIFEFPVNTEYSYTFVEQNIYESLLKVNFNLNFKLNNIFESIR